jgi:DNA-directed RNA polymerase subunit L
MKMNIIKEESNHLEIEFETKDYTIPDLIASQLRNSPDVEFAGVSKDHPDVGKPVLIIKTSKKKAKDALIKALDELDEALDDLKKSMPKEKK